MTSLYDSACEEVSRLEAELNDHPAYQRLQIVRQVVARYSRDLNNVEPTTQFTQILQAVYSGCRSTREISDKTGLSIYKVSAYVSQMVKTGVLNREGWQIKPTEIAILSTDPSACGTASLYESSLNPSSLNQPEPHNE